MFTLFGKEIHKEVLLEAVGDLTQICGIHSFVFDDGLARGVRGLDFRNPSGLRFVVLPDRGMDIYQAEYKGIPLNWLSGTGVVSSHHYSTHNWDWLRNFFGGLLVTCGLSNVGDHCIDGGAYLEEEYFGAHGRISNLPARSVHYRANWEDENYILKAEGEVIEASAQGEKLKLMRRIQTEMGKATIRIHDSVHNMSFYTVPHMFLYHINFGYPLLDEYSEIFVSCEDIQGLNATAEENVSSIGEFCMPDKGFPELVFIIHLKGDKDGYCNLVFANRTINNNAGLGVYLRYPKKNFPYFNLWKRLNRGEYVVGFEPGNCTVQGRVQQRKRGDLRYLEPQETAHYAFEIGVLGSNDEIDEFVDSHRLSAL